ncbi:MAG TPA: hypothetical protein VLV83_03040 [Acidobacteriota bacterium]|nr:hypothetical protein [Acidobacteriota bacterium]
MLRKGLMRSVLRPFNEFLELFEAHLRTGGMRALLGILAGLLAGWWIYVPLHELLHAWGCLASGGQVERLEIDPLYGADFLARLFPYVHSGSAYAGRLSGFDTGGSDWTYAVTIAAPFLLGLAGFPLLRLTRPADGSQGQDSAASPPAPAALARAVLFGGAALLAGSPLLSLTGDLLELGTLTLFQVWPGAGQAHRSLISDDLFRLLGQWPGPVTMSGVFFLFAAQLAGAGLGLLLIHLSHGLARGSRPEKAEDETHGEAHERGHDRTDDRA